jgi:hypothetical protein
MAKKILQLDTDTGNIEATSVNSIGPTVTYTGVLEVLSGVVVFIVPMDCVLTNYTAYLATPSVGSDVIFSIRKNGIQNFLGTVPTGEYTSGPVAIDLPCTEGDRLSLDITAVGSMYQGAGLTVRMMY